LNLFISKKKGWVASSNPVFFCPYKIERLKMVKDSVVKQEVIVKVRTISHKVTIARYYEFALAVSCGSQTLKKGTQNETK